VITLTPQLGHLVLVALGGFAGACSRYGLNVWFAKRLPVASWPVATLVINLSGTFLLGLLVGLGSSSASYLLLGTGFLGAYTTFSTFAVENIQLLRQRRWKPLLMYIFSSLLFGMLFAYAGYTLGLALH